ncbi:MAG TPA: hypothetical protein VHZ03_30180 [Trebonia sp.]|nr:hypothetical protein [Trebonia sp.]
MLPRPRSATGPRRAEMVVEATRRMRESCAWWLFPRELIAF